MCDIFCFYVWYLQNKDLPIENTTDCMSTMASICCVMIDNPYVFFFLFSFILLTISLSFSFHRRFIALRLIAEVTFPSSKYSLNSLVSILPSCCFVGNLVGLSKVVRSYFIEPFIIFDVDYFSCCHVVWMLLQTLQFCIEAFAVDDDVYIASLSSS